VAELQIDVSHLAENIIASGMSGTACSPKIEVFVLQEGGMTRRDVVEVVE